jgi:hypothetical protein
MGHYQTLCPEPFIIVCSTIGSAPVCSGGVHRVDWGCLYDPYSCLEDLSKTRKPCQYSQSPGRYLNPGHLEREKWMLTVHPRCSDCYLRTELEVKGLQETMMEKYQLKAGCSDGRRLCHLLMCLPVNVDSHYWANFFECDILRGEKRNSN